MARPGKSAKKNRPGKPGGGAAKPTSGAAAVAGAGSSGSAAKMDRGRRSYLLSRAARQLEKAPDDAHALSMLEEVWPESGQWSGECLLWLSINALPVLLQRIRTAVAGEGLPESFAGTWASVSLLAEPAVNVAVVEAARLPAEWTADYEVVQAAFAAISDGLDDAARGRLAEVGLRSPFRESRAFLTGLQALYAGDRERGERALGMVAEGSALWPVAQRWIRDGLWSKNEDWERCLKPWSAKVPVYTDVLGGLRGLHGETNPSALEGLVRLELTTMLMADFITRRHVDEIAHASGASAALGLMYRSMRSLADANCRESTELLERAAAELESLPDPFWNRTAAEVRLLAVKQWHERALEILKEGGDQEGPEFKRALDRMWANALHAESAGVQHPHLWMFPMGFTLNDTDTSRIRRMAERGLDVALDVGSACVMCLNQLVIQQQADLVDLWWPRLLERHLNERMWSFVHLSVMRRCAQVIRGLSPRADELDAVIAARFKSAGTTLDRVVASAMHAAWQRWRGKSDKTAMATLDGWYPDAWERELLVRTALVELLQRLDHELTDEDLSRLKKRWKPPTIATARATLLAMNTLEMNLKNGFAVANLDYLQDLLLDAVDVCEEGIPDFAHDHIEDMLARMGSIPQPAEAKDFVLKMMEVLQQRAAGAPGEEVDDSVDHHLDKVADVMRLLDNIVADARARSAEMAMEPAEPGQLPLLPQDDKPAATRGRRGGK